jgi:hypothetical protein
LLLAYAEGTDPADTGIANDSKLRVAVLDAAVTGAAAGRDVPANVMLAAGLSQDQPNAVRAGDRVFVAWRTVAAVGDASGEELWLKALVWNGAALDLSATEIPLPRASAHRPGDQRRPALAVPASPAGTASRFVTAFDDLGRVFGGTQGNGDVAVEAIPVPLLRLPGEP